MDASLRIITLGGVRLLSHGELVTGLSTRKAEALLIYLASTRRSQPREVLADLLWDERTQSQAMGNLRGVLTNLRQVLGDALVISRDTAGINPKADVWLDTLSLEDKLSTIRKQGKLKADTARQAAEALELYQGEFLQGFTVFDCRGFEDWSMRERERLHHLALEGLSELVDYELEQQEYQKGRTYAARLLELDPLMESAHRQMMLLLASSGQRAAALSQYETCQKLLKQELEVEPEMETRQLYEQIRSGMVSTRAPASVQTPQKTILPKHNLPVQLTSFIGREEEMLQIKQLLTTTHLLTLTGTGGTGKTRLALEVAAGLIDDYPVGVWLVELAPLRDPVLVEQATATVLGVHEQPDYHLSGALVNHLTDKQILLVLDNCEHLLKACAKMVDLLLHNCPKLKILATSRMHLNLSGEKIFVVPPLTIPDPERVIELDALTEYEAVRLFIERAIAVQPSFKLKTDNSVAVTQICSHLDGIPLAIELAAARVRHLSPEQIAKRLVERFSLLMGGSSTALPHQQTLQATLEWSYDLLNESERTLFRRLAVFVGGFSLESAEVICSDEYVNASEDSIITSEQILDLLGGLVDHSLVTVKEYEHENRYFILETIDQFAIDKLRVSGELARVKDRHLAYFLKLANQGCLYRYVRDPAWETVLITEYENIRFAMDHAISNNLEIAITFLDILINFIEVDMHRRRDGYNWGIHLFQLTENWPLNKFRAKAVWLAGDLSIAMRKYQQAEKFLEMSLNIAKKLDDKYILMNSYSSLSQMNWHHSEWSQMHKYAELSLPFAQELQDKYVEMYDLLSMGLAIAMEGDFNTGHNYLEQAYQLSQNENNAHLIFMTRRSMAEIEQLFGNIDKAIAQFYDLIESSRRMGDYSATIYPLYRLGLSGIQKGDTVQARAHFEECLAVYYEQIQQANWNGEILYLFGMAGLASLLRQDNYAILLLGAYESELETQSLPFGMPHDQLIVEPILDEVKNRLGETEFNRLHAEGHQLSLQQALEIARKI